MEGMTNGTTGSSAPVSQGGSATPAPSQGSQGEQGASGFQPSGSGSATPVEVPGQASQTPAPEQGGATETAAEKRARKLALKVYEKEEEYDLDDPTSLEKLRRAAQIGRGKEMSWEEANNLRQQAESLLGLLKDPESFWEAAEKLGHKPEELAEKRLASLVERRRLELENPDRLRAMDLERKLQALEQQKQLEEQQRQEMAREQESEQVAQHFDRVFTDAFKSAGVPKVPHAIRVMAHLWDTNVRNGIGLSPEQLAEDVREQIQTEHQQMYAHYDGKQLMELLGKENVDKIQKELISTVRGIAPASVVERSRETNGQFSAPQKKQTFEELRKSWGMK